MQVGTIESVYGNKCYNIQVGTIRPLYGDKCYNIQVGPIGPLYGDKCYNIQVGPVGPLYGDNIQTHALSYRVYHLNSQRQIIQPRSLRNQNKPYYCCT